MTTTIATRPTLQEMIKSAMAGTTDRANITAEAIRQMSTQGGTEEDKTASAADPEHYSTEHIHKLAGALGFIAENVKAAGVTPGEGPGALTVTESAMKGGAPLEPGGSGSAISKDQPPKNPALQAEKVQGGKANTGLETNDEMKHAKTAEALAASNLDRITKLAKKSEDGDEGSPEHTGRQIGRKAVGIATGVGALHGAASMGSGSGSMKKRLAHGAVGALTGAAVGNYVGGVGKGAVQGLAEKKAGVDVALIRKLAADANNPAQISAGKATPPDSSAAGEGVPSEPGDVSSQKRMIASNQSAIDYTKGQAKAKPKSEVSKLLAQPAMTVANDSVLQKTLTHTGEAGVKIAEAATRVKAARALLSNLVEKAASDISKKSGLKNKTSAGDAPTSPSASSGFTASSLG